MTVDVTVVGGGIVGLSTAYNIVKTIPGIRLRLLEKECDVGRHQSTHNSGVLHAGLYYAPGSLKARLARAGLEQMIQFCREYGIAHEQCGKMVVATSDDEVARLRALFDRGTQNGLRDLRWLERDEIRRLEPHCGGFVGIHVPEEGIVDFGQVCATFRRLIADGGGEIVFNARVRAITRGRSDWTLHTGDRQYVSHRIVNCAGLYSDRVASMAGERLDVKIVPFRGEYWMLRPERRHLVTNLIYPVPDPTFPFLGVHFTRVIHGGIEAGPNAVLALAREGYRWRDVKISELFESLAYPGLWKFLRHYPHAAAYEVARSLSKRLFVRSLQRLVPAVERRDLVAGPSGVRAQVMTRQGELVQDFHIVRGERAVHVINAPSPAATASLAIGSEIAAMVV